MLSEPSLGDCCPLLTALSSQHALLQDLSPCQVRLVSSICQQLSFSNYISLELYPPLFFYLLSLYLSFSLLSDLTFSRSLPISISLFYSLNLPISLSLYLYFSNYRGSTAHGTFNPTRLSLSLPLPSH